ncbi:uncharacterized protein JCM15063_001072 [Sporobolomyces koalae]|uniref:uncharacterized protein n=1 Tax=Sporobolomyces koalae TaxID=500713 RepID=UPI00316F96B0
MHVRLSVLTALLPTAAIASSNAQLYLSSSSSSSSSSVAPPISLTAPQTNAVLAHHLGVSSYVDLPLSSSREGANDWEQALVEGSADPKFVVLVECPHHGCDDIVPTSIPLSRPYTVPSLPSESYLAAITLHLHRFADSLHLSPQESTQVKGLKQVVEQGLKSVAGWQGWVGKELAGWIGYEPQDKKYRVQQQIEPVANSNLLSDLDFLDASGARLGQDLSQLASLADSFVSQAHLPKIAIVHLRGLAQVAKKHSPTSSEYQRASTLFQQTLSATLAAYEHGEPGHVVLLTVPPEKRALLRKRQPSWLHPFESPIARYTSRTRSIPHQQNRNVKRSVFVTRAEPKKQEKTVIVPSSSKCFKSLDELNNQTASCLSRGEGVRGLSPKEGECWVCKCHSTFDQDSGKKTYWAGQGCEKVDLSSSFSLLFFSSLGLVLILGASVALLYKVGSVELPGTLSAVGGTGGAHIKRD